MYIDNETKIIIITDHESLKYMNITQKSLKQLARWIYEFQEYNLNIQYQPRAQAVVLNAISQRLNFIGTTSGNRVYVASLQGINELKWEEAMIQYLKNDTELKKPQL